MVRAIEVSGWLTTEQAQSETVREILAKYGGASAALRPSVGVVEEAADRWRSLAKLVGDSYLAFASSDMQWQSRFVTALARDKVRSESAVHRVLKEIVDAKQRHQQQEADRLRTQADERERDAQRLQVEQRRLTFLLVKTRDSQDRVDWRNAAIIVCIEPVHGILPIPVQRPSVFQLLEKQPAETSSGLLQVPYSIYHL